MRQLEKPELISFHNRPIWRLFLTELVPKYKKKSLEIENAPPIFNKLLSLHQTPSADNNKGKYRNSCVSPIVIDVGISSLYEV